MYPLVLAGATAHQRKELWAQNTSACKAWTTYRLVRAITINQFAAAIDNIFYAILDDPIEGLNGFNLQTLVHHIATVYAQPDLDKNLADFNTGIDPGLPLAIYTRKQKRFQVFVLDVAVPISKATMVTTRTKHALTCGNMTMAWRKWTHQAIINHTWPNWKLHWMTAFAKMCNINRMTAGKAAFGANAAEEEHQARWITTSLNNLANASIQNNATIDNLVASNAQLMQALQNMQAAIVPMFPSGQVHPSPNQPPPWLPTPPEVAVPPATPPAPAPATMGHVQPTGAQSNQPGKSRATAGPTGIRSRSDAQAQPAPPGTWATSLAKPKPTLWSGVLQCGVPFLQPCTASGPNLTMQNSGSCCR